MHIEIKFLGRKEEDKQILNLMQATTVMQVQICYTKDSLLFTPMKTWYVEHQDQVETKLNM